MVKLLLDELKNLVTFARVSIFALSPELKDAVELMTPETDGVYVFKTFIEGGRGITGV